MRHNPFRVFNDEHGAIVIAGPRASDGSSAWSVPPLTLFEALNLATNLIVAVGEAHDVNDQIIGKAVLQLDSKIRRLAKARPAKPRH